MKKTLTLVLAAVLLLGLLAACGGGGSKYEGTYVLSKLSDWTVEEYADLLEISLEEAQDSFKIVLKSGGKAEFYEDGDLEALNWKVDGEKITLSAEGESLEGTIKDGKITFDMDGDVLELTKK